MTMRRYFAIHKKQVLFLIILLFSSQGHSQVCPTFALGTPITNLYTVSFRNLGGLLLTDCTCQLSSGTFKCGVCLPILYTTYSYVSAGNTITCTNPDILPVELKNFDAVVYNGDIELVWSTETERDNEKFIIERSTDAHDYTFFAEIKGAINSTVPLDYSISDTDPLKGISYYRLSERDINGKITLLAVVSVEMSSALSGTIVAPNPASGMTKLLLPWHSDGQMFDVTICNNIGLVVNTFQASEDTELELNPGVYSIVVRNGSQTWSEKLVMLD
jgi:hypothetical protein